MRIFELLTAVIDNDIPACSEESLSAIYGLLAQQNAILANHEILSAKARDEMIGSLREELKWRARLRNDPASLHTAAAQWTTAQLTMLRRLEQDRDCLQLQLFAGCSIGQIVAIAIDLSDRHDGACAVAILSFADGGRLVYKPRSLDTESWFYQFLIQVNGLTPPFSFASLKVLARESYGWVEFALHRTCACEVELYDYYRHAGALLCLLRLLRVSDCHFQNLIACGSQPVLIDAETLFQPLTDGSHDFAISNTSMLPAMRRPYDIGALSCSMPQQIVLDLPGFVCSPVTLNPRENLPFREDQARSPHLFVEQMEEGFSATWHFLSEHRAQIASLLDSARNLPVRVLHRDTPEYYRQILLFALGMETDSTLSAGEVEALRRCEVPRFTRIADENQNGAIVSGFEAVLQEVAVIDDAGLDRQLRMLRLLWTIYGGMRGIADEAVRMTPE
ncbi:type 2 lanthipeptide synthetase LanM [Silvibacterium acidisoli]|uniref:type 2 lanthipeptide synthetase LanM n=1 Tax=Acidobacteriaceae bacterium ZG23-2 TaxID=2883246 RepID=UPI00406CB57E